MKKIWLFPLLIVLCGSLMSCEEDGPELDIIASETTLSLINDLDKAGRWLATGIDETHASTSLSDHEKAVITNHLHDLALDTDARCNDSTHDAFLTELDDEGYPTEAKEIVERAYVRVCSDLNYHEGYWVTEFSNPSVPFPIVSINDMHIDAATKQVTVYAQSRVNGTVQSPPQVGPGEFTVLNGDTVGHHPNAVYLNGSGQELMVSDGTGAWWVKHAWVLDGEGYTNWPLNQAEIDYGEGLDVTAILLEDGLTMKIGDLDNSHSGIFNIREVLIDQDPITYLLANGVIASGPSPTLIPFDCTTEPSAFDSLARSCPVRRN